MKLEKFLLLFVVLLCAMAGINALTCQVPFIGGHLCSAHCSGHGWGNGECHGGTCVCDGQK
ncbi:unnamed protein product [Cylicocyclus nassatus]|uniref:Defensin n=1 Tax=Cylicocyclus nassatus TaxID=53992 RepID=A0AA36GMS6_CYLNA|nr:unnamed protein product [Cylicocyclus nassatus]